MTATMHPFWWFLPILECPVTIDLNVEAFILETLECWQTVGAAPYLDKDDGDANCVKILTYGCLPATPPFTASYFTFQDLPEWRGTLSSVHLRINQRNNSVGTNCYVSWYLWDGSTWIFIAGASLAGDTYITIDYDVGTILNTIDKINAARFKMVCTGGADAVFIGCWITHVYLRVSCVA